jgi:poly(3-hydroxybutyrate) depolymerase
MPNTSAGTANTNGGASVSGSGTGGSSGGAPNGGSASGGVAGTGTGGSLAGGAAGSGSGGGGMGTPGNYPLKNAPVKSAGCGTQGMQTLTADGTAVANGLATSKRLKIMSSGESREYIIDIPANYDNNKPYRLFYTSHWIGSTDTAVATGSVSNGGAENWGFYGLHREAMAANDPAIFVAPQSQGSTWQQKDHALFDDILAKVTSSLCVDTSRVFATGFSFGGMITYSLSTNHQKVIRAAVGIAPANYNIYLPNPIPHDPIAWMSTTGMSDNTCPYDGGNGHGSKYIAMSRAMDNGCTVPDTIPTWSSASPTRHVCYDFQGCKSNYPLKVCTFNGNHQAAPFDAGGGDNGLTSWIPSESWKFFTQF